MEDKKSQLEKIVGKAGVIDNPEIKETDFVGLDLVPHMKPRFMVKPRNVDEVQKIVLWANRTLTPLVPVSSGSPHFHGDTVPTAPEAVIVDLSGMNRILKIDRRNRLALIEPGVTYGQLQPVLRKENLRIVMPLLPRVNKSVLAGLLEREPLMSPRYQWNLLEPLRSLEIVWGNGDKLYSGSGVFRGEEEEDWKKGLVPLLGAGPGQLDFYKFVSAAQGSMGIVTWASVRCEVFPEFRKLFFVPAEKIEDVIDFTYKLLKLRFGDELFIMNGACLSYILSNDSKEAESLKSLLPPWTVVVGITGGHIFPKERVQAREKDILDMAREFGLKMIPAVPGCNDSDLLALLLHTSKDPYWKLRYRGDSQEIFFLTTLDRTPSYIITMYGAAEAQQYPAADIGVYIQPVHQGVGCHCEFVLPFDRMNRDESSKVKKLFRYTSLRLAKQGAYFSRPYGMWADMVFDADEQTMIATRKVKTIFDPNNVMNPGKLCF